jgi:type I restriction enzyme S subunit
MTRSGTIGRTAFVRGEMDGMAASDDVIRIIPDESAIRPGYLFVFLTAAPAQAMIGQKTYGSVVQHIEPHHIADLPVPLPEAAFQERIHALVDGAAAARTEATCLLDEAGAYFDAFAGPMPSAHDHARAAGIVARARLDGRLDAFYHVGWAIEGGELRGTAMGELGRVTRPGIFKRIWVERGVPFVSGIDVYQVRAGFRQKLMRVEAERAGCLLRHGQVLVQRSGQRYGLLGRPAYVGLHLDGWAGSEHLMRIGLIDQYQAGRVFSFLRSEAGHRAVLRSSYGTSIPELNPEGLSRVEVPLLPPELTAKANRALELRERADADEERAIQEVEAWLA